MSFGENGLVLHGNNDQKLVNSLQFKVYCILK